MTHKRMAVILGIGVLTLALGSLAIHVVKAASTPVLAEKSLAPALADQISNLETHEREATVKLQAVAQLILAPIQAKRNEVWTQACKDAGFPLAECAPDPTRRVVTHKKEK